MSTHGSVDPESLAATKQEIRSLVAEIADLSKSDISETEFYAGMLNRVVSALAAPGGAVWVLGEDNRLELQFQIGLHETELATSQENQQRHGRLLLRALSGDEGMLVAPHSGGTEEEGGNPTEYLLVLGALATENQRYGVLEVFQRPGTSTTTQRGYLRFLLQICELATSFLKSRELRQFATRETLWNQLEQFSRGVHESLDPRETAYILANEGRRLIDCDRVSVAIRRGRHCRVEAVSGQDTFENRSTSVVLLGELASLAVNTGDEIWYTGDTSDMAPQVEEAIHEYADQSHTKALGILPLWRAEDEAVVEAEAEENSRRRRDPPIGALIIEQINHSHVSDSLMQRIDMVRNHGAVALGNSLQYDGLFLMPLWRAIGNQKWLIQARTLPKTITISAAIAIFLLALFIVPGSFKLTADGTLQPSERRDVFVPESGVVTEVFVEHGEMVAEGDPLVQLENSELRRQVLEYRGQLAETNKELLRITRQMQDEGMVDRVRRKELAGQRMAFEARRESLEGQIALVEDREKQLLVTSPISGVVVTWEVKNRLKTRPVDRGQILMTIANPDGEWELEVLMPDGDMGHVVDQLEEQRADGKEAVLDVGYVLATDPSRTYDGYLALADIQQSAEVHNEQGNSVQLRVAMHKDPDEQPPVQYRRPGATVKAKVYCGRASLAYCWFHDLIDAFRTYILFRFF
ncbi:MAG: efflux RND transporter periplasmic adaptor subunit [Planctomycetota bacterium]|nr:MAG: efflux RND transporter periplasmic adaptor subunit [Planctomycetota bacterium]REK44798.1 MAG: efflux RND transporter periplasmic adaptor subunit [Planctomycetota bacterium]